MISYYYDRESVTSMFHIWIETEEGARDGMCIGAGMTPEEAYKEARKELEDDLQSLEKINTCNHFKMIDQSCPPS